MEYLEKIPFVLEDHNNNLKFKETLVKKKVNSVRNKVERERKKKLKETLYWIASL